ncbi:hypothetical protein ACWFNE_01735 [Cellulomonas sp. NPDC055163]
MTADDGRSRATVKRRMRELSRRLDQWDPIGVYRYEDGPPPGEYDHLVAPTFSRLRNGATAEAIAAALAHELVDHFGLQPSARPLAFAEELRRWWDSETHADH